MSIPVIHLLPCPLCGSFADLKQLGSGNSTYGWVQCRNTTDCGCSIRWFTTFEAAMKAWNRRTVPETTT